MGLPEGPVRFLAPEEERVGVIALAVRFVGPFGLAQDKGDDFKQPVRVVHVGHELPVDRVQHAGGALGTVRPVAHVPLRDLPVFGDHERLGHAELDVAVREMNKLDERIDDALSTSNLMTRYLRENRPLEEAVKEAADTATSFPNLNDNAG